MRGKGENCTFWGNFKDSVFFVNEQFEAEKFGRET